MKTRSVEWKQVAMFPVFCMLYCLPAFNKMPSSAASAQDDVSRDRTASVAPVGRTRTAVEKSIGNADPELKGSSIRLVAEVGHSGWINAVKFSPDGACLLTGSTDRTARLWDARSGRFLRALIGHSDEVSSVDFSPDGALALSGSQDGKVRIWNAATGETIREFTHGSKVSSVSFSFDGKLILTGGEIEHGAHGGNAVLWDAATGKAIQAFLHGATVSVVAFSPDAKQILTGGADAAKILPDGTLVPVKAGDPNGPYMPFATVRVWDAANGRIVHAFEYKGKRGITAATAAFSPDGKSILAENELRDVVSGELIRSFDVETWGTLRGSFSANGKQVVSAGDELRIWDADTGRLHSSFALPNGETGVYAIDLSSDGRRVIIGGDTSTPRVLDLSANKPLHELTGHATVGSVPQSNEIAQVVFSDDDGLIATGSLDQRVRIWDINKGQVVRVMNGNGPRAASVQFSSDGKSLLVGGSDGKARLWNTMDSAKPNLIFNNWDGLVDLINGPNDKAPMLIRLAAPVSFSPKGKRALTGFVASNPKLWDIESGSLVREIDTDGGLHSLTFLSDGIHALAASAGSDVKVLNTETGLTIRALTDSSEITSLAVSRDGVALCGGNGWLRLWDIDSGDQLSGTAPGLGHVGIVRSVAFSKDGDSAASGGEDGTARVWQVTKNSPNKTLELIRTFEVPSDVLSVSFSNDGRLIATGSEDGFVRLWDVASEESRELCSLFSSGESLWFVVAPDGRFDASDVNTIAGLNWIFSDDPFHALAPETFLRDYYEPRLLTRLIKQNQEFRAIRNLATINRVQPVLTIANEEVVAGENEMILKVQLSAREETYQRSGEKVTMRTESYDIRLFRNGQLVDQWPEPPMGEDAEFEPDPTSAVDMQKWRELNRVVADGSRVTRTPDGKMAITFPVRLPHRDTAGPVEFTAYAFNEDRVKSETARFAFEAPANPATTKPRAYLIGMGVSVSENVAWNLRFAADDARLTVEELSKSLPQYDVVPVLLTSETGNAPPTATRENLLTILQRLGGHNASEADTTSLPNVDKLQKVTPDDLVLIAFSGHGYTDVRGTLHLLPYDVGSSQDGFEKVLPRCISSGDLATWLKDIDAGELVLVLDACHSAAAGAPPGFKPGPLGGRGLAQLAYDKGMRVLAASQADDVALESETIQHGLLTYALIRDGLEARRAAPDDQLTLSKLLAYSADRVPVLYEEVLRGEVKVVKGKQVSPIKPRDSERSRAQRPELFDYGTKRQNVTLH